MAPAAKAGAASRACAARIVARVMGGESLDRAFDALVKNLPERDRPLCRELAYGTLRFYPRLEELLSQLVTRPFRNKDSDVKALALIGLYQLGMLRVPEHAAVSATVDAATVLRKRQTSGLLNAVLRRYLREKDALEASLSCAAEQSHPAWFVEALHTHWPQHATKILEAGNQHPPMTLRINASQTDRDTYAALLADAGMAARAGALSSAALTLENPVDVARLPGFADGLCSVQDEGAQLAAMLLQPKAGERVLDACAAPGGKTGHLLEIAPDCALTAMDVSADRLARVQDNLERLGAGAELLHGDAAQLGDKHVFDAILLDVPCSATGVIRRHPDIKLLRRPEDPAAFAEQQRSLLRGLWPRLTPGGRLLYVSCSLLPAENSEVIANFLENTDDAVEEQLTVDGAAACKHGIQLIPNALGSDGLYYALLKKHAH